VSDIEKEVAHRDIKEGLGFSPCTGRIVAIGLYDYERKEGVVYFEGKGTDEAYGEFTLKPRNEREMLEDFWAGAIEYDTFVTFNGRGFDIPFLSIRSVVHGIRPSHDLMKGRYLYQQKSVRHVDLQDQFTFYGALHRRPSLHLMCRAFGIGSPKAGGIQGDDIAELIRSGEGSRIAQYNAGDVRATTELYTKWYTLLAPQSFTALHDDE
jgi:hypothetical protein